jgi:elongation factor P
MATTSDISKGVFIWVEGELGQVMEWEHITPNKAPAMYHVKLRNVRTGKLIQTRFHSGDKIDLERVEVHELQYIYREGENLVLMNNQTYEQMYISAAMLGDSIRFLKEEMILLVSIDSKETAISAEMPNFVELMVTYSEPGVKGDTATNSLKPATVETGAEVRVPLFVDEGTKIKIDTRTGAYVERVK